MMKLSNRLLWSCVMAIIAVEAYRDGAPVSACITMKPGHGVEPQTTASPYTLNAKWQQDQVTVTISGPEFEGFLLQAQDSEGHPVGLFNLSGSRGFQNLNCLDNAKGTVTHTIQFHGQGPDGEHHEEGDITTHMDPSPRTDHTEDHHTEPTTHTEHTTPHPGHTTHTEPTHDGHNTEDHTDPSPHTQHDAGSHTDEKKVVLIRTGHEHDHIEDVLFRATVVKKKETFWVGLTATSVKSSGNSQYTSLTLALLVVALLAMVV